MTSPIRIVLIIWFHLAATQAITNESNTNAIPQSSNGGQRVGAEEPVFSNETESDEFSLARVQANPAQECPQLYSSPQLEQDVCCVPPQQQNFPQCKDRRYCFAMMMAHPNSALHGICCPEMDECREIEEFKGVLNELFCLRFADICLAFVLVGGMLLSWKKSCKGPATLSIILASVSGCLVNMLTSWVIQSGNLVGIAEKLLTCFSDAGIVYQLIGHLKCFTWTAAVEAGFDLLVIVLALCVEEKKNKGSTTSSQPENTAGLIGGPDRRDGLARQEEGSDTTDIPSSSFEPASPHYGVTSSETDKQQSNTTHDGMSGIVASAVSGTERDPLSSTYGSISTSSLVDAADPKQTCVGQIITYVVSKRIRIILTSCQIFAALLAAYNHWVSLPSAILEFNLLFDSLNQDPHFDSVQQGDILPCIFGCCGLYA